MNEQIKQIAERLRGLRDVLELTAEDIARDSDISAEEYRLAETGDYDISVSMLQKIARTYNIALDALMFGEEPKMSSYFVTRAGNIISIQATFITRYEDFDKKPVRYRNQSILLSQENRKLYRFLLRNRQSAHPQCSSKRIPFQTLL